MRSSALVALFVLFVNWAVAASINITNVTNSTIVDLYNATEISEIEDRLTQLYGTNNFTSSEYTNSTITQKLVKQLLSIDNSTTLNDCQKCIARLELGVSISLTRKELIPIAWTKWCIASGFDTAINCEIDYGINTVDNSSTGSNFANLLTLIDPAGYDGQLYCYYKEDVCDKPATPKVDISYMWPEKQDKYKVAPTPGNETFNVLHVSDFHLEIDYKIGGEANCTDSMCCTPHSENKDEQVPSGYNFTDSFTDYEVDGLSYYNSSYVNGTFVKGSYVDVFQNETIWWPAATFGNYECDAPEVLINSSLKSIADYQKKLNLEFEFAIFTGDLVDHDQARWISFETAVKEEEYVFRDLKYKLGDIPVFPVLGNHDTFPYGQLAQNSSGFNNLFDWNADLMADLYEDYNWITQEEAQYAREHYTGFAATTKRGLKIVSLNANAWYQTNLYNYWNASNPDGFGQFQFLVDELVESEKNDQRVWIIAHIPFNEDSLPVPAAAFASIVERFSPYTIAGIFFGHTHLDQFNLLYAGNGNDTKTIEGVINHAWVTQAVTPWIENNPAWRYYSVDSKTFSIMNSYNYFTRLNDTFTNNGAEPIWEFEYSAREAYNNITNWPRTSPLNATFWHKVAQSIKNDINVNQMYTNFETRFSPYTTNCATSGLCRGNWCLVTSFTVDDFDACKKAGNITDIFD